MTEDKPITSPDPVDINAIAPMVRIRIPPTDPRTFSAMRGVTRPRNFDAKNENKTLVFSRQGIHKTKDMVNTIISVPFKHRMNTST